MSNVQLCSSSSFLLLQSSLPPESSSSMAVGNGSSNVESQERKRRRKHPGVRVVGKRIYDSEHGKSCHQCRQKTMEFTVTCKKLNKDKPCTLKFCHNCLLKRYGEEAEEVDKLEDWSCPKCRDVCNCSFCMKRKGCQPTGPLTHTAKQIGFRSVHEFLDHHKDFKALNSTALVEVPSATPDSSPSYQGLEGSKRSCYKDNQCLKENKKKNGSKNNKCNPTAESEGFVSGDAKSKPNSELCEEVIVLPQGSPLLEVAGVEFPAEDVGCALQFKEFCNSFTKVLDIKKGQPEHILQDLVRGGNGSSGLSSPVVQFNIKLLSLIEENINEENWIQALGRRITKSRCPLDTLPRDTSDKGLTWYHNLEQSEKLRILNFLCDEILGTVDLRNCIDEENAKFYNEIKEIKEKVLAVRKEEKLLRQQVRDVIAQALGGAPLFLSEHDHVISGIRTEADKKHAELLKYIENLPKKKQRSEASGVDPILVEGSGHAYWKLRSHNNNSNIILQDIRTWDSVRAVDKWYIFNEEEEKAVENHISSASKRRRVSRPLAEAEEGQAMHDKAEEGNASIDTETMQKKLIN
ncbi:Uncharacterized protein M6B38_242870 [Iris pallida]|uniref:DDT domain-containing protein n=1 Tax=Iris pallida TaxID=29817 RepID=A0AAX6DK30_IRIPA|nr:Uncharacterized protein M6B38_242870 [Iris pallida]